MGPDARVGIYYCPSEDDPLFVAGAAWLGRNPASDAAVVQPPLSDMDGITAEARVYGFHATLKPPMRLPNGRSWEQLVAAAHELASRIAPFELPLLQVMNLHGFLALRETSFCPPLQALADICVEQLDRFRAPPSDAELARRRRTGLTDAQEAMLVRFGYPYVLQTWFFHMTLTRRLSIEEHEFWRREVERFFDAALKKPQILTDICLFTQTSTGTPFTIAERIRLRG
jgi:hypothetical protein